MNIYTSKPEETTITAAAQRLQYLVDTVPALLEKIPDAEFAHKASPDKWSKKEILGHLMDSAANNNQRFVRIQFQDRPAISYNQNEWVTFSSYQNYDKDALIDFWKLYNIHLLHVIKHIAPENLSRTGIVRHASEEKTLSFFINDYVAHAEHHLRQLVDY